MNETYRAIEVSRPGVFTQVRKPLVDPGPNQVRIRVEACGVCHSDSATVDGLFPISYPRVPGHEVVGRIDMVGDGVRGWTVGQRVGVGFLGGACGYCEFCRGGDLVNCRNQEYTGVHSDGGYAEVMIAKASGLMSIPRRAVVGRRGSIAVRGADNVQCPPKCAGEGGRPCGGPRHRRVGTSWRAVRAAYGLRGRSDCSWRRQGAAREATRGTPLHR